MNIHFFHYLRHFQRRLSRITRALPVPIGWFWRVAGCVCGLIAAFWILVVSQQPTVPILPFTTLRTGMMHCFEGGGSGPALLAVTNAAEITALTPPVPLIDQPYCNDPPEWSQIRAALTAVDFTQSVAILVVHGWDGPGQLDIQVTHIVPDAPQLQVFVNIPPSETWLERLLGGRIKFYTTNPYQLITVSNATLRGKTVQFTLMQHDTSEMQVTKTVAP